ncbi:MAG: hypothetical protein ACIARR_11465 [Phycisphaerales bacterium JB059]
MSVSQGVVTGVIGLLVAGAGAVGVYNFTTTGCFMGSCSSEAGEQTAATVETAALVEGETPEGDSCCPLKEANAPEAETTLVALESEADGCCAEKDAEACADAEACDKDAEACAEGETCDKDAAKDECGAEGDGCCKGEAITADD